MQLIKYEAARQALAECESLDEIKDISDKMTALKLYAKQKHDTDMEFWIAEIKVRAARRIGELTREIETKQGTRTELSPPSGPSKKEVLKQAGISKQEASRCERIASLSDDVIDDYIEEKKSQKKPVTATEILKTVAAKKVREEKIEEIEKGNQALPDSVYSLLYVDPPWRYEHVKTESRAIENQYPTMPLEDIKALEVPAADDCILFLWATSPKLEESMQVINAWGFTYRTCAIWDKQKMGMGYYFRQQHELLLIAVKGSIPTPLPENRPASLFSFPRGQHSQKPHEVYEMIEAMYPEIKKCELFARNARDNWDAWGNQSA